MIGFTPNQCIVPFRLITDKKTTSGPDEGDKGNVKCKEIIRDSNANDETAENARATKNFQDIVGVGSEN